MYNKKYLKKLKKIEKIYKGGSHGDKLLELQKHKEILRKKQKILRKAYEKIINLINQYKANTERRLRVLEQEKLEEQSLRVAAQAKLEAAQEALVEEKKRRKHCEEIFKQTGIQRANRKIKNK